MSKEFKWRRPTQFEIKSFSKLVDYLKTLDIFPMIENDFNNEVTTDSHNHIIDDDKFEKLWGKHPYSLICELEQFSEYNLTPLSELIRENKIKHNDKIWKKMGVYFEKNTP